MYEYNISFKSSSDHANANALSRLPIPFVPPDPPIPPEPVLVLEQIYESPITADQIHSWSRKDPTISNILHYTLSGWPNHLKSTESASNHTGIKLFTQDGILLWGNRVVVPPTGHMLILEELTAYLSSWYAYGTHENSSTDVCLVAMHGRRDQEV